MNLFATMRNIFAFCCLCVAFPVASIAETPELWLGHYNPENLGNPQHDWKQASRAIDGIEFYINMIAYKVPPQNLVDFCKSLRKEGIEVGVSGGYFDWVAIPDQFLDPSPDTPIRERERMVVEAGIGVETARVEMKKLENLISAADGIDVIALDGPIRRFLYPGADLGRTSPVGESKGIADVGQAVDEIIRYMQVWREAHPRVRFVALTNFPNWGWDGEIAYWGSGPKGMYWGDFRPAIDLLIRRCEETGVPLEGVRVDHPFEFATGEFSLQGTKWPEPVKDPAAVDWLPRILELENIVRSAGLKFELIVNSEYGGATSNEAFAKRSLEYLDLYHRHGGRPDRYILEGWYRFPDRLGPDSEPFTLSHTAVEFADRIQKRDQSDETQ
ncbi:hypothetical protein [Stieleria mannarensis]|uniref:hypothetical protein n=1 Tax=Stieleria mannarensis TaxID=2755585 RepID=UPI00160456CF|nr:hypothetical protein [Rhodopirellula sp. JC639]